MTAIRYVLVGVLCALTAAAVGCVPVHPPVESAPADVDYDALAQHIVRDSAAVREGDRVLVHGTVEDSALMEGLAVAVRQRGAFPLLTLTSERLERRMFEKVPEKYDSQPPQFELSLAEALDVIIELVPESEEIHPGVPPDRVAKVFASRLGLHARHRERGVRQVYVGNELYPSRARAERYGMPYEALARNYWGGLATNAAAIRARASWVRDKLAHARTIEVTNPNGTRVTMTVAGSKLLVSDGLLSDAELEAGGEEVMVWLPAGEVYAAPAVGTVNGTVVVDRLLFQEALVEGLRIDFVEGRVAGMSARTGFDGLKKFYDAAGPGKELFSALDIGINPNVDHIPGASITSPVAAGMVTLGIGRNTWAGGDNDVPFGVPFYLPGSTLAADGEKLIVDGVLLLPPQVK